MVVVVIAVKNKALSKQQGPGTGADLCFLSLQPDTSLHCQTTDKRPVHRTVCPFDIPAFAGTRCIYPGRQGQADLTRVAAGIQRWFTHLPMITHPSTVLIRKSVNSLRRRDHQRYRLNQTATPMLQ